MNSFYIPLSHIILDSYFCSGSSRWIENIMIINSISIYIVCFITITYYGMRTASKFLHIDNHRATFS